jgi:predicted oxidoreductase
MATVSYLMMHKDGPEVSRLVAGMMRLSSWGLSRSDTLDWIKRAIDAGITTFDHADIYGGYTCEGLFGEALALDPSIRQRMQLVTKCNIKLVHANRPSHAVHGYDSGKAHILESADNSLRELQTDYLDVLLIHRVDPLMDADEVAEAFNTLRDSGKVLHFGVSNFLPPQFNLLASRLDFPLVTNQIEVSILHMDSFYDGSMDLAQQLRIAPMAWSPFAGGRLFRGDDDAALRARHELQAIGEELGGASPDQVALAWLLTHPANIIPVLGTGNLDRIESAVQASSMQLSRDHWFRLWEASMGHGVP